MIQHTTSNSDPHMNLNKGGVMLGRSRAHLGVADIFKNYIIPNFILCDNDQDLDKSNKNALKLLSQASRQFNHIVTNYAYSKIMNALLNEKDYQKNHCIIPGTCSYERTALHYAVFSKSKSSVEAVYERWGQHFVHLLDHPDQHKLTALQYALVNKDFDIANLLINAGANANINTLLAHRAFYSAVMKDREILKFCQQLPHNGKALPPRTAARSNVTIPREFKDFPLSVVEESFTIEKKTVTPKKLAKQNAFQLVEYLKRKVNKINVLKFNKMSDLLKSHKDWEIILYSMVGLHIKQKALLRKIALIRPIEFRGCDQEVLHKFYSFITQIFVVNTPLCKCPDSSVMENLNNLISFFDISIHKVDINDESQWKLLNSGAVNSVYRVGYRDKKGVASIGVFKPASDGLPMSTQIKEEICGTAVAAGIPAGVQGHLSARAVASSIVDEELYGEKRISVKTEFAIVNGQRGILMEMAAGSSPKFDRLEQEIVDVASLFEQLSPDIKGSIFANEMSKRYQIVANIFNYRKIENKEAGAIDTKATIENKKVVSIGTRAIIENFDPGNPSTIEGLIKLQIKDIITGECDRHPGNYYIHNGEVKGIDEDCSFGINALPRSVDVRKQASSLMGIIPNLGSLMLRMPPVITIKHKESITSFGKKFKAVYLRLAPYISSQELYAMGDRLAALLKHIKSDNCCIVQLNEELLEPSQQFLMNTNNSYYKRELLVLASSIDQPGWNHLRQHREF